MNRSSDNCRLNEVTMIDTFVPFMFRWMPWVPMNQRNSTVSMNIFAITKLGYRRICMDNSNMGIQEK